MTLWKVHCMEDRYPGMWLRWYANQCAAVGWAAKWGFTFAADSRRDDGWGKGRAALKRMELGDYVLVALRGHRVGRLGRITSLRLQDNDWAPLVPPRKTLPDGEMGRRIEVRWELTVGPPDRDFVVALPANAQLSRNELLPTVAEIKSRTLAEVVTAMNNHRHWVGLLAFRYEKAISDYIAAYPHRLEDGLTAYPDAKIREQVFPDGSRLDVLLVDGEDRPVVVECKQHIPSGPDLDQLRGYMKHVAAATGRSDTRGILVYSGSRTVPPNIVAMAQKTPRISLVSYSLGLTFSPSTAG